MILKPTHDVLAKGPILAQGALSPGTWLVQARLRSGKDAQTLLLRWQDGARHRQFMVQVRSTLPLLFPIVVSYDVEEEFQIERELVVENVTPLNAQRDSGSVQAVDVQLVKPTIRSRLYWSSYIRMRALYRYIFSAFLGPPALPKVNKQPQKYLQEAQGLSQLSIVVPCKDKSPFLAGLWNNPLQSVLARGGEVIVVDHASETTEMLELLSRLKEEGVKVVLADGPFNYSRLVNRGIGFASKPIICTLNNDVADLTILDLEELVADCAKGWIVSPQLRYPDGSIQFAGIALGMSGMVGHFGRHLSPAVRLAKMMLKGRTRVSAVTGAAMMFPRALWHDLNGFDEDLWVEYNDIDFCLRAETLGCPCMVNQDVIATHIELATRGEPEQGLMRDTIINDRRLFLSRWLSKLAHDPWYPQSLSRETEAIELQFPPSRVGLGF